MNHFFSARVRALIANSNPHITQAQLAEIIGVSAGALSKYLSGDRTPPSYIVANCAAYFNVTVDYLLGIPSQDPSNNETQLICDQTGLSLSALENILEIKDKRLLMALNDFLTSSSMPAYLRCLFDIFSVSGNIPLLAEEVSQLCDETESTPTEARRAALAESYNTLSSAVKDLRALSFQLSMISADIAEEAYAVKDYLHQGQQTCARAEEIL